MNICLACREELPRHAPDCPTAVLEDALTTTVPDIPTQLRTLADRMEAAAAGNPDHQVLDKVDLCLVVMTSAANPRGMVHCFGRRPTGFEAQGLLFSAAVRVPA